jgi:signal transduction histidine kinase
VLEEFVTRHRDEIIRRCRAKVAVRSIPPPTAAEIDHGVPLFLDQLVDALRIGQGSSSAIGRTAVLHGQDLRRQGFTVSQVVHDYGDVCQAITELAVETNAPISPDDFRTLNACLDDAIAIAVTQFQFARERNPSAISGQPTRDDDRLGFLAHELRNLLNTATLAFDVLKSGNVGVGGSTGSVLQRSLAAAVELVGRSLDEVRFTQTVQVPERFFVSAFIEEITPAAGLDAEARSVVLKVMPVEPGITIEADRKVLAAVVTNLLQNACKFTRRGTTVTMRVVASAERVLFEIEDACGGLPNGDVNELFRPYEQRGADRTGLGLGLAFARWGIEANNGRVYARDLPGEGCIFTVDLPRLLLPAPALS